MQTKSALKAELTAYLQTQRTKRRAQTGGVKSITLGITVDKRISTPGRWR